MTRSNPALSFALGLIGAIVGGVVGYYAFFWIASQGFYALILPTALVGIVAGFCSSERSELLAALCPWPDSRWACSSNGSLRLSRPTTR